MPFDPDFHEYVTQLLRNETPEACNQMLSELEAEELRGFDQLEEYDRFSIGNEITGERLAPAYRSS